VSNAVLSIGASEVGLETYIVETWGCQMNVLDSQYLEGQLQARGMCPARSAAEADVALLNTCSVREKAVQKVLSRLGELRQYRYAGGRPKIVGLCGCVAEQDGAALLARSRVLSFVLGPGRLGQLGHALDAVEAGVRPVVTGFKDVRGYDTHLIARGSAARQYVTAVHGCNQHCTFCVVPYTRGHEASRPLAEIVDEVGQLGSRGAREVTLLGQTVNAYRCPVSGADFGVLLQAVGAVAGPWRVQFLTSHPKYFNDNMIETIASTPRVGSYLHVPFQAGSDTVLKRMHRGYTSSQYLDLVRRLRLAMPAVTLSTDVIVGFPGETDGDFRRTLELVGEVRFGQLFGFVYSARPRTPAARYDGRVPRAEAGERLARLFEVQNAIQLALNQRFIGSDVEVLVDGPAKRGEELWQGRGDDNRVVNFPAWEGITEGDLATLRITGATAHALLGSRSARAGVKAASTS
jgi:tRNA-2-methylthio-N6-dimethylallyladenosine synthase